MFKGTYRHRIDGKGRLPVPAAFRRALEAAGESGLVMTPLDDCLAAFPTARWRQLETQLRALPAFSRPVKALTRLLASRAVDCPLDVQGRIRLGPDLRAQAGLAHEAVVVGVMDRFEIWRPEAWDDFVRDSERILDDVSLDLPWPAPTSPVPVASVPAGDPPAPPSRTRRPQAKPKR